MVYGMKEGPTEVIIAPIPPGSKKDTGLLQDRISGDDDATVIDRGWCGGAGAGS